MLYRLARLRVYLPWLLFVIGTAGCSVSDPAEVREESSPPVHDLSEARSFHASFDQGLEADFSRGDSQLYSAPKYDQIDQASPGIDNPDITLEKRSLPSGSGPTTVSR